MKKILIVEDNVVLSQLLQENLKRKEYEVIATISEPKARKLIKQHQFDLILSDVRLPDGNGIKLLEWLIDSDMLMPFVIMTDYASYTDAVHAIKLGAYDYLPKPVSKEKIYALTDELLEHRTVIVINTEVGNDHFFQRKSKKAQKVEENAKLVAPSDMSVLILGANGTGKEHVAQTIHQYSARKDKKFVSVNCGAIPKELAVSSFFGHKKGAFTGADMNREGYFAEAEGGTLFLDEIGNLPYDMQALLLRVLQEKTYRPVGENKDRQSDVRIVCATNSKLREAIIDGAFREDLYYRLSEFEINLPTLSECPEDILPLATFFRELFSKELNKVTTGFSKEAENDLQSYSWSGNIRELQHRIKRAVLLSKNGIISAEDLNLDMNESHYSTSTLQLNNPAEEQNRICQALKQTNGNKRQAAKLLNIDPATLYRKMKRYGI